MKKIVIASENLEKISGISRAFQKFFKDSQIRVKSLAVPSGVPEQPVGNEIFVGAENRLNAAKKLTENHNYDYIVSCESGLVNLYKMHFNVQVVLIYSFKLNSITWGISDGVTVPKEDVEMIKNISLKKYFMEKFDGSDISKFSKGLSSRDKLILQATIMALSAWNWK